MPALPPRVDRHRQYLALALRRLSPPLFLGSAVVATYVVLIAIGSHLITSETYPLAKQALGEQPQNMDEGATSRFKWSDFLRG